MTPVYVLGASVIVREALEEGMTGRLLYFTSLHADKLDREYEWVWKLRLSFWMCVLIFSLIPLFQVFTYKQSTITHQKVTPMHQTSAESVEDMAALVDLHEGSIMHNLFQRYQQDKIYVSFF